MIKYNLTCECSYVFDSWFSSSEEFERLKKRKLITCTECNSSKVKKSIMAPSVYNSKKHNLLNRTRFVHCDVDNFNFGNYDVIVSNPPYICSHRINDLSEDIRRFEPKMALDGGSTGLNVVNKVIVNAGRLLKTNGYLFLEIGSEQITKVSRILMQNKFKIARIQNDYANNIRCIISTKLI